MSRARAEAMSWLRLVRDLPAVCSGIKVASHREWAPWSPCVLGCDEESSTQIEVFSDIKSLREDIAVRAPLFSTYVSSLRSGDRSTSRRMPNYLYYMVTPGMAPQAHQEIQEALPQAGVLIFRPEMDMRPGQNVVVLRGASALHDTQPGLAFMIEVMSKASTQLCSVKMELEKLYAEIDSVIGPERKAKRGPNTKKEKQVLLDIF